ncbi:MAG TPA: dATP/dGTP diphosphohydrolase domain-containing protein [Rhodanobacter sp.]|nr:dATP/dGTP diphosphohydrolase domain-containing protein [Rhodanobacter sp.]
MSELASATAAKYAKVNIYRNVLARFPRAFMEIARVSEYGAKKHEVAIGDMSYLDIPDAYNMYTEACMRHMAGEALEGFVNHEDADMLHAAQLAWNALARLEVFLRNSSRPPATEAAEAPVLHVAYKVPKQKSWRL